MKTMPAFPETRKPVSSFHSQPAMEDWCHEVAAVMADGCCGVTGKSREVAISCDERVSNPASTPFDIAPYWAPRS